jgi:hypothetical protein
MKETLHCKRENKQTTNQPGPANEGQKTNTRVIRKVCPEKEIEGKFHQNWS